MKSKRVLTVLVSMAIMLSFMPTLAFAAPSTSTTDVTGGHTWTIATDESNLEKLVEPTCVTPGVGIVTCSKGDGCVAKHNKVLAAHKHKNKESKTVTADEFYAQMLKEGYSKEYMDAWMESDGVEICTGEVDVCKDCGFYLEKGTTTLITPDVFYASASKAHVHPTTGMKECDESFTCVRCGKAGCEDSTYFAGKKLIYHGVKPSTGMWSPNSSTMDLKETILAHGVVGVGNVMTNVYTCKACGEEVGRDPVYVGGSSNPNDYKDYHTNETVVLWDSTCDENGFLAGAGLEITRCTKCGDITSFSTISRKPHTWVTKSVPATESERGYEYEQCSGCGAYKDAKGKVTYDKTKRNEVETTPKLEHAVTATVVAPKNCQDNTWVLLQCANPDCKASLNNQIVSAMKGATPESGTKAAAEKIGGKYYVRFGSGASAKDIEIPFEEAAGHNWGEAGTIVEATCVDKALEGRKCTVCGAVYHDTVRETAPALGHAVEEVVVDATCGAYGYTYRVCTRCNNYLLLGKDGKTLTVLGNDAKAFEKAKYAVTQPKVKLGEKCTYEWKVLEESTPFKKGTRAKVCTVCNHLEEATKESIAEKKIAAPKVKALKKKAKVTVKAVDGAVKYQIVVNGKVVKKNAKAGKTYTIKKKNLKLGKKNKFQIVAFDADGVKATSKAKSVKIKKK